MSAKKQTKPIQNAKQTQTTKAQRRAQTAVVGDGDYRLITQLAARGARAGVGAKLGSMLDTAIVKGFGDYTVTGSGDPPRFAAMRGEYGGDVLTETSFVVNIVANGGTAFALQAHPVNSLDTDGLSYALSPSNADLHRRGSRVAAIFEEAVYRGCVMTYVPAISELNANGTVLIAVEYDPSRANFADEPAMRMSQFSIAFKPSEHKMFAVECAPRERPTQVIYLNSRPARPGSVQDSRFDCLGRLFIATAGLVSSTGAPLALGTVIGQLYISVATEFLKPCLPDSTLAFSPHSEVISFGGILYDTARFGAGSPNLSLNTFPTDSRPTAFVAGNVLTINWPAVYTNLSRFEVLVQSLLTTGTCNSTVTVAVTMTNGLHYGSCGTNTAPTTTICSNVITGATGIMLLGYEVVPNGGGVTTMALDMTGSGYSAGTAGTCYIRITRLA